MGLARVEAATSPTLAPAHPAGTGVSVSALDEFTVHFTSATLAYQRVQDYTATFVKQQRIKGELLPRETAQMKFMKPFSVYFKWTEGPNAGMQVLYVAGQNEGRLLARPGGLLGVKTFRLDPTASLAMKDNLHPITEAGIGKTLELLEVNRRKAMAEGRARVRRLPANSIPQVAGPCYELIVEADEKSGYYCRRAVVTFDPNTHLLIGVQTFGWDARMIEEYRYVNLQVNCGLTARDFDPKNPAYGF
ncbi:MAG: DUF1571 domain-containing protein [Candidatus Sumerlaeia bacterium]|nr:DUF1571 domain-containing protein [Candidatus Sumerlaeia bacterium]